FPLLGSIVTLCGNVNQVGFNGDVVLAGESYNDTLFGGPGNDILIGDNGVVVQVKTLIPIDTRALLSDGTTFPPTGGVAAPALIAPTVVPRIGILGNITQTAVGGNVSLNGAAGDNILDGATGDDILIGNNGVVVQLAVLAVSAAPMAQQVSV